MVVKVVLKGTPAEIGRQRVRELRSTIHLAMDHLMTGHGPDVPACLEWGCRWQPDVQAKFPHLMEEIVAESRELGIGTDLGFAFNYRAWNAVNPHPSHPLACYNILFRDSVRGPLLGGVVEDGYPYYVMEEIHPKGGIPHFAVTLAGTCWAVRGFNAEGLAVGQVSAFPGEYFRADSTYRWGTQDYSRGYFILRTALQTLSTAREASEFCSQHDAMGTFMFADRKGEAFVVEKAGRLGLIRKCEGSVAVSGGHYSEPLIRSLLDVGVAHAPYPNSLARQQSVFRKTAGRAPDLELMKTMLTSHENGEGWFCIDITQMTTIAIPQAGKFLVAGYVPCTSGFVEYEF